MAAAVVERLQEAILPSPEKVELRFGAHTVAVHHEGVRVALHLRSHLRGRTTTLEEHMPKKHRHVPSCAPQRIAGWAVKTGPETAPLGEAIMVARPHPEPGFRSCLRVVCFAERYGPERLEAACARRWQSALTPTAPCARSSSAASTTRSRTRPSPTGAHAGKRARLRLSRASGVGGPLIE